MELRHLRYFIAAAEEQHFGRASDRLHVTRPAVSQIISDLEAEIGATLFVRSPQGVKLTAPGRTLLPKLQRVMDDLATAFALTRQVAEGKSGSLTLAYGSLTLLHPIFRAVIKHFSEAYPDVTLSLVEMLSSQQPRALADGTIQAGFMHFGPLPALADDALREGVLPLEQMTLRWYRIQTGKLGVMLPPEHRLATRPSLSLAELSSERFVVVPRSSSTPGYGPLFALCQKAGFEPNIVQRVNSIAAQINLVSVGMGIGLTVIGKEFRYPSSVTVVPLDGVNYQTSFVFAWAELCTDPIIERMLGVIKQWTESA
ncbi:LysR substrate-binding domain-containing protein [Paraburkholderia sp. HD33-4]|uniref:LysR substrate-binding domain-containing protein n=1 Tax=Paraburkholderia sp. HD33-4 TaxID=2883242 RepID=UPI001F445A5C|nr:LysR substrate-binding domain-containing protein [Paraburkholderia sp. HD33-4]